jgi:membrane protease YdiL (CAAX protease family)
MSSGLSSGAPTAAEIVVQQHSPLRAITLHLLPGVVMLGFFLVLAPLAETLGMPSLFVLFLGIPCVIVPIELGYLLYKGKQKNGSFSLKGVVLYREPIPLSQYVVLVALGLAWMGFLFFAVAQPLDRFLIDKFFAGLPAWFFGATKSLDQYARTKLLLAGTVGLVGNGIAGPIVEELYFRGYLLPRISYMGKWAPAVSSVLFSVYHFFTPWQNPVRLMALVPMTYIVAWNKNIYWGMIVHASINTLAMIMFLVSIGTTP